MSEKTPPQVLEFALHASEYALARLPRTSPFPMAPAGDFCAVICDRRTMTVVCIASEIPASPDLERNFRCLEILGCFDLDSVGVVATATQPLARAGISLFAFSTWETDYILVHGRDIDRALTAITAAGHTVRKR